MKFIGILILFFVVGLVFNAYAISSDIEGIKVPFPDGSYVEMIIPDEWQYLESKESPELTARMISPKGCDTDCYFKQKPLILKMLPTSSNVISAICKNYSKKPNIIKSVSSDYKIENCRQVKGSVILDNYVIAFNDSKYLLLAGKSTPKNWSKYNIDNFFTKIINSATYHEKSK